MIFYWEEVRHKPKFLGLELVQFTCAMRGLHACIFHFFVKNSLSLYSLFFHVLFFRKEKDETVPVYNISNGDVQTMSWGEVFEKGKTIGYQYPFEAGLWYPNGKIRTNPVTHFLAILFLQIIPAYFIDGLLFLAGQKTL